jgi:predicted Zn-dependent protease
LLPILFAAVVASAQSRLAARPILIAHRPLDPDTLRAQLPAPEPTTVPADMPTSGTTRTTTAAPESNAVRNVPTPSTAPEAGVLVRQREQSAAQLVDEASGALRDEHDGEAFNAATACLRREPSEPECLRIAAIAALRMGHFDDARPYVDRCLQERPDEPQCLAGSAQLALRDRDLTLAGITSWRLSQVAPNSVDTYVTRAQLAELQGDTAAATRSYRAACEAGQPVACRRLGELVSASSTQ